MNAVLEFCLTLLALYGVSYYIIVPILTMFFAIIIVLYKEWDEKTDTERQKLIPFSDLLIAMMVFPIVYSIFPPEFQTIFWQGIPILIMLTTGVIAVQTIVDRKLNRKEKTRLLATKEVNK